MDDVQDKLIIKGIPPYDGTYEFDLLELLGLTEEQGATLTNRELHRIKIMSGVRAGEIFDSLNAGDNDLVVAIAAIVLERRGKRVDDNLLWDAPAGAGIDLDIAQRKEDEENPPEEASATVLEIDSPRRSGGESSSHPSVPPDNGLSPTGLRDLPKSADSALETSAS